MEIIRHMFDTGAKELRVISISNDDSEIIISNYFNSPWAEAGLCYLSGNAGAARLLVPDSYAHTVPSMHTGKFCVLTTGRFKGRDCIEIMFDDKSRAPFSVVIEQQMCDFSIQPSRTPFKLSAWTRTGKVGEWTAFERAAKGP
jgi:hypothetical protein